MVKWSLFADSFTWDGSLCERISLSSGSPSAPNNVCKNYLLPTTDRSQKWVTHLSFPSEVTSRLNLTNRLFKRTSEGQKGCTKKINSSTAKIHLHCSVLFSFFSPTWMTPHLIATSPASRTRARRKQEMCHGEDASCWVQMKAAQPAPARSGERNLDRRSFYNLKERKELFKTKAIGELIKVRMKYLETLF